MDVYEYKINIKLPFLVLVNMQLSLCEEYLNLNNSTTPIQIINPAFFYNQSINSSNPKMEILPIYLIPNNSPFLKSMPS